LNLPAASVTGSFHGSGSVTCIDLRLPRNLPVQTRATGPFAARRVGAERL